MNCWRANPNRNIDLWSHPRWPGRRIGVAIAVVAACMAAASGTAKVAAAAPSGTRPSRGPAANSAALQAALNRLSSHDFKTRRRAFLALSRILAARARRLAYIQRAINTLLKSQGYKLKRIAPIGGTPELRGQAAALLRFNQDISRWALKVLALPRARRDPLLRWGFQRAQVPLVAALYSRNDVRRVAAIGQLAKSKSPAATTMLALLVGSPDQAAHLSAIKFLWHRPATPAVIDALWWRAIRAPLGMYDAQGRFAIQKIVVHGRVIMVNRFMFAVSQNYATMDSDVATDLLVHFRRDKALRHKVLTQLRLAAKAYGNASSDMARLLQPQFGAAGVDFVRLVRAVNMRRSVPLLMQCVARAPANGFAAVMLGQSYYLSAMVDSERLVAQITGQNPATYGLVKIPMWNNRWAIKGNIAQQNAARVKMLAWWKANKAKYMHKKFDKK